MRWECRYSSCEMMYLDVGVKTVRCFLDHSEAKADVWSFEEVLAGTCDPLVNAVFPDGVLAELKAEVRRRLAERPA